MGENKKVLCYDIISYVSVLIGFDVILLADEEIMVMLEKLQELSDYNLLLLHDTLSTIYKNCSLVDVGVQDD